MSINPVSHEVRQFIVSHFPQARTRALSDDDPLLENGIIDSLGVIDIVSFIEAEFRVTVADEELVPDHFQNIGRIAAYIENKQRDTLV